MTTRKPDMLSEILVARRPELAGKVHYVDGRPYCDGVNHTTRCDPASTPERKHPIAMSLHFEDADPVATCLVTGCGWHGHGDAMIDATNAWVAHVADKHRLDWGDE